MMNGMYAVDQIATLNTTMKIVIVVVEVRRPPGVRTRSHIERQKPPRRQPKPSVKSGKNIAPAPNTIPVAVMATRYAPWIASGTGGFMT